MEWSPSFHGDGDVEEQLISDDADIVRLAARFDATIVPFSGLGGDDSFQIALDSNELLELPATAGSSNPYAQ